MDLYVCWCKRCAIVCFQHSQACSVLTELAIHQRYMCVLVDSKDSVQSPATDMSSNSGITTLCRAVHQGAVCARCSVSNLQLNAVHMYVGSQ